MSGLVVRATALFALGLFAGCVLERDGLALEDGSEPDAAPPGAPTDGSAGGDDDARVSVPNDPGADRAPDAGSDPTDAGTDAGAQPVDAGSGDEGPEDAGPDDAFDAGIDVDAGIVEEPLPCIDVPGMDCECDLRRRGPRTYLFCTNGKRWEEARDRCEDLDAELVVVDNAAEDMWLIEQMRVEGGDWWIGLHDRDDEGDWTWVDGSRPGYTGWDAPQEPNDWGGGEDCVEVRSGVWTWNDEGCWNSQRFVCERGP